MAANAIAPAASWDRGAGAMCWCRRWVLRSLTYIKPCVSRSGSGRCGCAPAPVLCCGARMRREPRRISREWVPVLPTSGYPGCGLDNFLRISRARTWAAFAVPPSSRRRSAPS